MRILISPAKRFRTAPEGVGCEAPTTPRFGDEATRIRLQLAKLSPKQFAKKYHLSEQVAQRSTAYHTAEDPPLQCALLAFDGDVYRAMRPEQLSDPARTRAWNTIGIISGYYGLLQASDLIRPYRFDMDNDQPILRHKSPYVFWEKRITDALAEWAEGQPIINLASLGYSKVLAAYKSPLIHTRFLQRTDGQLRNIGLFAKQARGLLAAHLLEHPIAAMEELRDVHFADYAYNAEQSDAHTVVFVRDTQPK